jgi:hypothetical protein
MRRRANRSTGSGVAMRELAVDPLAVASKWPE